MTELSKPAVDLIIVPPTRDLGGFQVRRALPNRNRQMIGPFIFLDQVGPAQFPAGQGIDVRPHPHIGLATVTYLFAGSLMLSSGENDLRSASSFGFPERSIRTSCMWIATV